MFDSFLWNTTVACVQEGMMSATYPKFEFDKDQWDRPSGCKQNELRIIILKKSEVQTIAFQVDRGSALSLTVFWSRLCQ